MGWGQALQIGGMAEQDISAFIAAGKTTEEGIKSIGAAQGNVEKGYDASKGYLEPYADMGSEAYGRLQEDVLGGKYMSQIGAAPEYRDTQFEYTEDPAYKARVQAGMRGLQESAAGRGSQLSGETLRALTKYAGDEAAKEYGAAYQRYQRDRQFKRGSYDRDRMDEMGRYRINQAERAGEYGRMSDLGRTGTQFSQLMATNELGRYGTLANLDLQLGGVKAGGWQAAADAAYQQGQHLQEIGGMDMGGDDEEGAGGIMGMIGGAGGGEAAGGASAGGGGAP